MVNVRVPLVNIQTPQFITIRLATFSEPVASTVPFLASTFSGKSVLKILGAAKGITKFEKTNTREIQKIYGFNGNEYEPAYVVQGQVSTSLTLDRIVFHDSDVLSMLGYTRGNVLYQDNPFVIIEDQYALLSPKILNAEPMVTLVRSLYYNDCWITDYPITYDIQADDLIIIPSIRVECGKIISSEEIAKTILSDVSNVIFSKIKLTAGGGRK